MFSMFFLGLSFLSVWIRRDPKIWLTFLFVAVLAGMLGGPVNSIGLLLLLGWIALWFFYREAEFWPKVFLFGVLILTSFVFKFHLYPIFQPAAITQKFLIWFDSPLVGLLPLALLVPVAASRKDWKMAFKGFGFGCVGIAIMALLANIAGAAHWQMKMPPPIFFVVNLIFVAIPEEAFYRGFVQNELVRFFKNKSLALLVSSLLFTFAHMYWAPNPMILGFVFIASLLYGGVYLITGKIESAILTHYFLNAVHITFFSYHAL